MIDEYWEAMHGLANDIAEKIYKGYIVGSTSEQVMDFKDWQYIFKINKYNFGPDTSVGDTGVPLHTDAGLITILQDDEDVDGLEIFRPHSKSFVPSTFVPDTFFINVGDLAHVSFFFTFYL